MSNFAKCYELAILEQQAGRLTTNINGSFNIRKYIRQYHPDKIAQRATPLSDQAKIQISEFVQTLSAENKDTLSKKHDLKNYSTKHNPCTEKDMCNYFDGKHCTPQPNAYVSQYVPGVDIKKYKLFAEKLNKFSVLLRTLTRGDTQLHSYAQESLGMFYAKWVYEGMPAYNNCQMDYVNSMSYVVTWNGVSERFAPEHHWYDIANVLLKKKVTQLAKTRHEKAKDVESLMQQAQSELDNVMTLGLKQPGISATRRWLSEKITMYKKKLEELVGPIDIELKYIAENYSSPEDTSKMMIDHKPSIGVMLRTEVTIFDDVSAYKNKNIKSNKWIHRELDALEGASGAETVPRSWPPV